jgi:large subunit ribosomal protein L21
LYAVIRTGGKQYRVSQGQQLEVERLRAGGDGDDLALTPVLIVDGEDVVSAPSALASASVTARVMGESKGPKITGFTYKPKTNQRRRWGHRQRTTVIEITGIERG